MHIRFIAAALSCALLFGCASMPPKDSGPVFIKPAPGDLYLIK